MWGSNKPNFLETAKFSIIENITITPRELGRGSYGTVYAAVYNGKPCVAKELHPYLSYHKSGQNISTPMDIFVKEINTMSSLKHPSIVQFLGVYFKKDSPILVMERMWKNLSDLLEEQPNQLSLLIKTHILYDVACGLQYLHGQKKPVIHRDLHASNILVNDNLEAKIADLGQAKGLENLAGQQLSTAPGKTAHMAPETLKHNPTYDVKMDIFSFGCTVIHLVTEKFPTPSDQFVLSGNGTNSFTKVSEVARRKEAITVMANITILQQIVLQCLHDEPSHRPNMSDICVQLTRYIKEMETQSPSLAQLYKQDKLSLLHSCQSQIDQSKRNREIIDELTQEKIIKENYITEKEDYIAALELELKDARSKLKQSEQIAFSLKKELDKQVKINNQVTKNYQNRVDRLQEDLKTKQHETRLKTEELIKTCTEKEDMVVQLKKRLQEKESQLKESGSKLHKWLLELQQVNETKHQQLHQQLLSYTNAFKFQKANTSALQTQMLDFKKKSAILKQQLEEKSYRLSVLESSHSELQELFYAREEKLKTLEQEISVLGKLLENNDRLQRNLEKDLNSKEGSLKQKNEELQLQKKEHADKLNKLHAQYAQEIEDLRKDNEMCKSQTADQGELSRLLEAEGHFKSDLVINTEKRFTKQENDIKVLLKEREDFKKQINHQEINIKEKVKYIEKLEKKSFNVFSSQYYLSITWYQYMSLPVHRCRPSAVVIKDKVFITGGYQKVCPQRKDLYSYLKYLERGNEVFCFNAGKCRYDSIASPVVLGGVVSVNGQCVLVSGAEGNTLTGNVYVLCEEGSDEQWKKFSEPVPTPRILPCVCCYDERWMIVCGGYACKEGSSLLEAVNVVEILDTINGEWYALADEKCLGVSAILCCAVAGEDLYIIGDLKIFKCNSNKLITVVTRQSESSMLLSWYQVDMQINDLGTRDLHPFSVAEINGEPMIIASISGSTNDVTCVLMKDTTDTWRKMNEAVECQHCSAVVVTPTLELLLFGGSQKVSSTIATNTSQKGSIIPVLNLSDIPPLQEANKSKETLLSVNSDTLHDITGTINQPPAVSFTGPIHAKHFDHKGGTFQSPVHKVSIVVPPNAIDDGEKVTVYMGATTSGPFDLPEDCKLRSAVVWLGSGSDVVLKRNIAVVVPHSAVFTSPHHHSMMRLLTCEDCEGPRYKFNYSQNQFEIDEEQGWTELTKFSLVAIAASPDYSLDDERIQKFNYHEEDVQSDDEEYHEAVEDVQAPTTPKMHQQGSYLKVETLRTPPARYVAKLFWFRGQISNSFQADIYCLQNLPTEFYKVNTLYRKAYYEDNGVYPEIVGTEFLINGDGTELKCVLPCSGSSECNCLSGWNVTQMNDISEVRLEKKKLNYKIDPMKFSFAFNCCDPKQNLLCCFEIQGAERIIKSLANTVPGCLQKRYNFPNNIFPYLIQQFTHHDETAGEKIDAHHMTAQDEEVL